MSGHHMSLQSWAQRRLHSFSKREIEAITRAAVNVAETTPWSMLKRTALQDEFKAVISHPTFLDTNGEEEEGLFDHFSGEDGALMDILKVYRGYCDAEGELRKAVRSWASMGREERELAKMARGVESEEALKANVRTWKDLVMSVERRIDLWCVAQAEELFHLIIRVYHIPSKIAQTYVANVRRWNYVSLVLFPEMVVGIKKNRLQVAPPGAA